MRSRRCFATAVSSLLLLAIACEGAEPRDATVPARAAGGGEVEHKEPPPPPVPGAPPSEAPEQTGVEDDPPPENADPGSPPEDGVSKTKRPERGRDGCRLGEMRFEGECWSKKYVKMLLKRREQEALEKVQKARDVADAAQGARDLLEQKTVQMDKVEDDLDEILDEFRRQQEEEKNKKEEGP